MGRLRPIFLFILLLWVALCPSAYDADGPEDPPGKGATQAMWPSPDQIGAAGTRTHSLRVTYKSTLVRLVCAVLVTSNILTVNYGVKQNQFTKPTSEPRASDPKESNEAFDHAIR